MCVFIHVYIYIYIYIYIYMHTWMEVWMLVHYCRLCLLFRYIHTSYNVFDCLREFFWTLSCLASHMFVPVCWYVGLLVCPSLCVLLTISLLCWILSLSVFFVYLHVFQTAYLNLLLYQNAHSVRMYPPLDIRLLIFMNFCPVIKLL